MEQEDAFDAYWECINGHYITVMKILVMLSFYISNLNNMYFDRNFDFIVLFNKKMFSARYQAILY